MTEVFTVSPISFRSQRCLLSTGGRSDTKAFNVEFASRAWPRCLAPARTVPYSCRRWGFSGITKQRFGESIAGRQPRLTTCVNRAR